MQLSRFYPFEISPGIKDFIRFFILGRPRQDSSYSQAGEDRVLQFLFATLGIKHPRYLDIGANNPKYLSNTYLFYRSGSSGVCIEPNPILCKKFERARPRDILLNVGIGPTHQTRLPFYRFEENADGLSSFSKENAEQTEKKTSFRIREVIQVEVVTIDRIMSQYFKEPPDLLSIDVEGLDLEILASLNYDKHSPFVICAETHSNVRGRLVKDYEIQRLLSSKGYFVYADTYINTIFVQEERFFGLNTLIH